METMQKLRDLACEHLDKLAKEDRFTNETLNDAYKLIDIVLDTYKVEEHKENGYSQRMGHDYSYYNDGYSRGDGTWEANGRYSNRYPYMSYGRWDNDGRYSGRRDSRGRYSREDGRSRMIGRLENMASDADGMDRDAIYHCIEKLKED